MNTLEVTLLQRATAYPSISLLMPIAHDNSERARLRLRGLAQNAIDRLRLEFDVTTVEDFKDRLDDAIDSVVTSPGQQGVAVYVGEQVTTLALSVPVRERVVVDETFATRDLVRALQRSPRYRIVTVGPKLTRLFEGVGHTITEVHGGGFPFSAPATTPISGTRQTRSGATGEPDIGRFLSSFDDALAPYLQSDPVPLVLVGNETRLAKLVQRSRHRLAITGTVRGAHDFPRHDDLIRLVWPTIENLLAEQSEAAMADLDRFGPGPRFATGLDEIWTLANQGRGEALLVEEGYEFPARIDQTSGHIVPAVDRDAPGVIDDLVDEIIEVVLAKRGRCHMVADDVLQPHGRIALKLRY